MLKVEDYGRIRRAHRDGMSIREIAQTFGHSRRKIRQALVAEPRPYTLSLPRRVLVYSLRVVEYSEQATDFDIGSFLFRHTQAVLRHPSAGERRRTWANRNTLD